MFSGSTMKPHRFIEATLLFVIFILCAPVSARDERSETVGTSITNCMSTINDRQNDLASTALQHWPRKQRVADKQLVFAVLFTDDSDDPLCNKEAILSALDIAVDRVRSMGNLLEGFNITVEYRNTRSSSKWGPLEAFDLYVKRKPGSFLLSKKNIVLTENSYIYIYKNHIVIDRTPSFRCILRTHRHVYAGTDLTLLQRLGHSDHYPRRNGRCLPQQTRSGGIFDADANAGQLRRNGIRIEWDLERIQLARWVYDLSHVG